jgi:hypothetical protein
MTHTQTGITPPTPGLSHEEPEIADEADIPTEADPEPAKTRVNDSPQRSERAQE